MKKPSGGTLHLLLECPASHALAQVQSDNVHAARGRRAALDKEAERRGTVWVPEVSFVYNVETQESHVVTAGTRSADLGEDWIVIIADAISETADQFLAIDDKLKRTYEVPAQRHPQLRSVALAGCRASGKKSAWVQWQKYDPEAYERDGSFVLTYSDSATFSEFELDCIADEIRDGHRAWKRAKKEVQAGRNPDVREGPWCGYCPAKKSCHAKVGLIRASVPQPNATIDRLRDLFPEEVGVGWIQAKALASLLHAYIWECEEYSKHTPVPLPDGRVLQLVEGRTTERVVDGQKAAEVVASVLGVKYALEAAEVKTSKAAIEKVAAKARQESEELRSLWSSSKELAGSILDSLRISGAVARVEGEPKVQAVKQIGPPKDEEAA